MRFLKFYGKQTVVNFLHKVLVACKLQIDLIQLYWEMSCFKVLYQKLLEIGAKWGFSALSEVNAWNFSDFLHEVAVA